MAYMVQPYSGGMGALEVMAGHGHGQDHAMGVLQVNTAQGVMQVMAGAGQHDAAMAADYSEACLGDAYYSGSDFSQDEAAALMAGPRAFRFRFRRPPRRVIRRFGRRGPVSPLANKHGHRWGWLIRCYGFSTAQKIAALPPQQRQSVLGQLRQQAIQSLPALMASSAAGAEGPVEDGAGDMGALVTMAGY
jgi:hypothetical protein